MSGTKLTTKESIEQFLAKGGTITKCPPAEDKSTKEHVRSTVSAAPSPAPMSLEDFGLIYGEPKKQRKRSVSSKHTVDMSALPDFLKKKYLKEVYHGGQEQEDEGEESEDEE